MRKIIKNHKRYADNKEDFHLLSMLLIVIVLINGCAETSNPSLSQNDLPISERNFYIGLVPNPAHSPNSSFDDIVKAYEETGKLQK